MDMFHPVLSQPLKTGEMKKLSLGQELSKNEQKKILGGGVICYAPNNPPEYQYVTVGTPVVNCSNGPAYCAGVYYQGSMVSCW